MQVQTAAGWSSWTPVYTFTVTPALPLAPVLTTPATASITNDNTPSLNWNAVDKGVRYQVQISKAATFLTLEQNVTLEPGVLTYTAEPLSDGLHYWRVRAVNSLNVPGAWAIYRYMAVDTLPPAIPSLGVPAAGASIHGTTKYTWSVAAGAIKYQFAYSTDPDFTNVIYTSGELLTAYLTPPVQTPGTFYWHVRAKDVAGNWGDWSMGKVIIILP